MERCPASRSNLTGSLEARGSRLHDDPAMAMTVLVVDDHPTFRRFVRRLLEESGFSVVGEAGDCKGALEAARALRPQAILLDVMLPDGSGLEIASALSGSEETRIVKGVAALIVTSQPPSHVVVGSPVLGSKR